MDRLLIELTVCVDSVDISMDQKLFHQSSSRKDQVAYHSIGTLYT